jgi:hypothetical protein
MVYDRAYRYLRGLDTPESEVGPALCVEIRRGFHALAFSDGTRVRPGARIGILHLNNERVTALARDDELSGRPGLKLRRQMVASLRILAGLCVSDSRFAGVEAFSATTIFHRALERLGFEEGAGGLTWPRLVGGYQRALMVTLRRGVTPRARRSDRQARQLWISRKALMARYGSADGLSTAPLRD